MQQVLPLTKGRPVFIMNKGHFPNRSDVQTVQAAYPASVVRTEHMYTERGVRFALTVAHK